MSDFAQIVVDTEVSAEQAPELANVVRAWLIGERIIEREEGNSVLDGTGHRPGISYRIAIQENRDFDFLNLRVKFAVGRRVFDAGGNGMELGCDACGLSFKPNDSWYDAACAWFDGDDLVTFACPSCDQQTLLTEWGGPWPWGFGNLGIEFWNWPSLSDDFIQAMTRNLGHRTVLVRLHL